MKRTHSLSGRYRTAGVSAGMQMTPETICAYISEMERKGRVQGTIEEYKRNLRLLYDFLPDHKRIKKDTLQRWRDSLLEQGYTARTANARVSAANSYLAFCGRRDLQLAHQLETEAYAQPELTRNEYLRLLQTARVLGKERLYLLIKLFGCTGIAVQNIERVTVEGVKAGEIPVGSGRKVQSILLPRCLQKELLDYAERNDRLSGALFVTRDGKPLSRTNVADAIRHLCHDAQVPEEKGNPSCLRRLYQQTQDGILQNISVLIDQAYERLLETEQLAIGWAEG